MAYAAAHNAYRRTNVETATREGLLIMLYDGLLRFMRIAQNAMEANDVVNTHTNLIKAQDIVVELRSSLDMQYEISHALDALYEYFLRKLVAANVDKSAKPLEEIRPRIEELREAWLQASIIVRSQGDQAEEA
jgi:flagellar secretion chaperone FliS